LGSCSCFYGRMLQHSSATLPCMAIMLILAVQLSFPKNKDITKLAIS
jgi:hypothetical protein